MSLGSDIAAEVSAAIAEASAEVGDGPLVATIIRRQPGDQLSRTVGVDTSYPCTAVVDQFSTGERGDPMIEVGDVKLMIAVEGLEIEPETADRVAVAGSTYEIMRVMPLAPGGVTLMYEVQGRGV